MTDLATLLLKVDSTEVGDAAGELDKLTAAGGRAEESTKKLSTTTGRSSTDMSRAAQAMKRDYVDLGNVLSAPNSPFVMPIKQAPAAAGAMRAVSMAAGVLGGLMGGMVVAGVAAAGAALVEFITRGNEAEEQIKKLVDRLKEQAEKTRQAAQAQDIFDRSIEGSIIKVRELTKAFVEQNRTLEQNINLNKAAAAGALANVNANIGKVSTDLAAAVERLRAAERARDMIASGKLAGIGDPGVALISAQKQVEATEAQVAALARQLEVLSQYANQSAAALNRVNFPLFERDAKEAIDPIAAINRKFDDMAKNAKLAGTYTAELAKQIERLRETELKAARDKPKAPSLAPVTEAEVARALGFGPGQFGGKRSAARNAAVDGAKNSYHLLGQAIDIPLTVNGQPLTKAGIRAALAPLGVEIKELLGPGDKGHSDHFHIAFGKKRLAPDQIARAQERAAALAQREAEQALNRQQAFQRESENLDAEILRAKGQLVRGVDAEADFAIKQLQIEQANYEAGINRLVADRKLEAADAEALKLKRAALTYEQAKVIETQRQLQHMERESEATQRKLQTAIDDLRFADDMATTASERRQIQLDLLDVAYQQKEAALRDLKARLELAGQLEEAARVQEQIARLPAEKAQDRARTIRGTMNPLEQWAASIPKTEAEITEAFQRIQVNAIDSLASAITDVITGTRSLGEAFGDMARQIIADIIQMTIRMLIFRAISGMFGGGGGGPMFTPSNPGVGFAQGGVFHGGNVIPFARGGIVDHPTLFPMRNGMGLMGEAGPEAVMPLARDSQGRLGVRTNDNAGGPIEVIVHVEASPDLMVKAAVVADSRIRAAEPRIIRNAASATIQASRRPTLMGRR